ncbi:hypothetical protein [Cupriavidus malaysiensis]|uniref:Glycosyltransferase RgtA/B/C/D-like domain-containing protein n=1 Tax=Cupriavidus malaysiensis TaxID=367825 RepID=A0ABM6F6W2_9BURK|nr:hypothetical protein [Cupriavidus malaysiensis]AOZ07323.1 hypothetical protein BKK80_16955 [Cupriavidus malaysiensis]
MPRPESPPFAPAFSNAESEGRKTATCIGLLVALSIVGVTYLRFAPWVPSAFYGDDLYNLLATRPEGDFVHSWEQALVGVFYEKYRPVFVTIWFALTRISHEDLRAFLIFNGLVHTLNATIFYFLALALSRNNRMTSIALTLVFASSRFALYQVTQGTGPVESVALTFFLLMLLAISQALQQPERGRWQWLALSALILALHTHERYLAVSPWLAIVLFVLALKRPGRQAAAFIPALLSLLTPVANFLVKTCLLGSSFFVGTGSTHLAPDVRSSLDRFLQALLSVCGINHGPDFLAGHDVLSGLASGNPMDGAVLAAAAVVLGLWIWLMMRAVSAMKASGSGRIYIPLFFLGLLLLILLPPALTIRMEQRWIYAPFCLFLLCFAWACGATNSRKWLPTLACVLACLSLFGIDTYLSRYFENIYMMSASAAATLAKRDIIDTKAAPQGAPLLLMASRDHCQWTFIDGRFFELYEGSPRKIHCEQDPQAFARLLAIHSSAYAFTYMPDVGFKPEQRQTEKATRGHS